LLGQLPLLPALREGGDEGRPITAVEPDGEAAKAFRQIAERIAVELKPRKIFSPQLKVI
jgi:ATP-binding protein involved in chromosome partitioning